MSATVSLATGQSHLGSDGRYQYVIAKIDPGVSNCLDTTGLTEGLFFLRFQGLHRPIEGDEVPTAKLVKHDEVRTHLPVDTALVDATARQEQLAERQLQIQRRCGR